MRKPGIAFLAMFFFFLLCTRISAGLKTKMMGDYYKFTKDEMEQMDDELRVVQPYGCGVFRYQGTPIMVITDPRPCSFTAMKYVSVYASDDTFALKTKWFSPSEDERTTGQSIAMLSYRKIYIADKENDCIQRIEYRPSTFSSVLMSPIGANAELDGPCGVAVAESGGSVKIYVADTKNHRIVRMNEGGGVEQYYGSYGGGIGEFNNPRALAKYGDFLYVADTYNNRIVALIEQPNGSFQWFNSIEIANYPLLNSVACDVSGNVYVVDKSKCKIYRFSEGLDEKLEEYGERGIYQYQLRDPTCIGMSYNSDDVVVTEKWTRSSGIRFLRPKIEILSLTASKDEFDASNALGYTDISFKIDDDAVVNIDVEKEGGGFIVNLVENGDYPAGTNLNVCTWDGKDADGNLVLPGAYFIRMGAHDTYGNGTSKSIPITIKGTEVTDSDIFGTWTEENSPYVIRKNNKTVLNSNTLVIEPGTKIMFVSFEEIKYHISVSGGIEVRGTEDDSVLFSSYAKPWDRNPGDWQLIRTTNQDRKKVFYHSIFEYGGDTYSAWNSNLLIVSASDDTISHCRISNSSGDGITTYNKDCVIEYSSFVSNADVPLHFKAAIDGVGKAKGNSFENNGDQEIKVQGWYVTEDATWQNQNVPYHIWGTPLAGIFTIRGTTLDPCTLTIDPGSILQFDIIPSGIKIGDSDGKGALIALGTISKEITFSDISSESFWQGIYVSNGSADLQHCIIENTKMENSSSIFVKSGNAANINNCIITSSISNGIEAKEGSNTQIRNCTIKDCGEYPIKAGASVIGSMTNNIYQNNGIQKIRVNGGTITEDAFWENPAIPYHIRSSISIKSEMKGIPTLTLESGNTLEFGYGIQMFIGSDGKGGRLVAQGTENSPIVFTAFDRQNRWYGIDFGQQMGEPSILQYCELSYGGLHSLIKCFNASPQVDHCSIDNSAGYGYGVWIEGNSAPEIAFCDIYDNVWGIWHVSSENTVVENCNIHQNSEYGIYCSYGEPEILQCNIYDNKIGIHSRSSALPIVNNCNIFGNSEFGVQNYGSISINAENNWWGSTTGPYDPNDLDGLYNPDGKGDCVSDVIHDYVDYEPYLTSGPHIFSEDEGATAANNSKKIQVEDEKVHYVWSSGGNVYYNWAQKTNELIWAGKKEVGPGIWPALDVHSDTINISWVSKHNPIDGDWQNSIYYANFIDEAFSGIFELYKGDPGVIIHPPAFLVIGDSGHVVIESYRVVQIDDPDAFIADWKIRYGNFQMDNPIITDWTTIDETVELLSEIPKTTPSMCEYDGNLSLVWSGVDGEIYYKERASEGWTEKQNLSNSTEPSWTPSINSNGPMLFCFWEEGEDPEDIFYCMKKADTWSSAEQVIQTPGRSVLPFFTEGTFLTWADSLDTGWEIFLKRRNFNGTWEDDEIISNTPGVKSLYPHCAYTEILINGYLYTIWTEGNDTPYEVKSKLMEAKPTPITFSGHISTNTTWYRDVYLIGDVIVDIGATLTINPGVKIYVKPHDDDQRGGIDTSLVEIIVEGGLVANGTYADSIIITSASDAPIAGDWWGIRFLDSSDDEASDLRFCRVDYGCIGVSCEFSSPVIKRCNFRDNAFLIGQRPQWPYPRPFYCLLGAGILCFESQAVIDSNLVIHNGWSELPLAKGINTDSLDSGIHCVYSSVTFTNNVVEDNNGGISSWGDNGSYYGSNQVIGNGTGGFGISGKALIENNTIEAAAVGSSVGISIYLIWEDEKTKVTVRGNTIDCHVSGIVSLLSPLGPGMQPESLLVFVSGNVIENNKAGISVSEGGENVFYRYILTKNYIISNDSIGVIVFGNPVSQGSNPVILGDIENMNPSDNGENHIYDNLGFDVVNEHPEELHAQGNFWGTTNEIEIDNRIYDDNENPSFGMVDFSGYYVAGEISQGETWRNIVSIGGDILVPEGITLTIEEGTLIRFASNCDMGNIGVDEERAELIVEGNLEIKNVTKEYGDLDIAASPWIEHISVTQEEDRNTRRNEVHEISNPHKDRCKYPEENIDRPPSINPVIFTSDAFEPKPSDWYGIELGGLNIEGRKKGQSGSRRSIAVIDGDARGVRDIHDCYVRYAARGLVLCEGEALSMKGCTFANNKVGLKIKELSEITVKECVFRENTEFGIFAGPTVTGTIKDDTVSGNGTGIALTGDASCDIKNVILQGNATGLHLAGTSYPTMKENIIINSADFGVYIMDDAHPDLGGNGRNCIYGSGQFDLYNGTDNDIMAKKNYWGTMDLDTIAKHIYDYYDDNSLGEVKIIPIWDGDRGLSGAMSSGKGEMPLVYSLKRVNPNPFDNIATIHYSIAKPGNVSLCIYDVSGRLVKTLCDERKDAGSYSVRWDSRDNMNRKVSAGVYFIRMETGNFISTKKALLVR